MCLACCAECLRFPCHCRKAALQVSMNDGLSFISSSVIITTTHCVSHHFPLLKVSLPFSPPWWLFQGCILLTKLWFQHCWASHGPIRGVPHPSMYQGLCGTPPGSPCPDCDWGHDPVVSVQLWGGMPNGTGFRWKRVERNWMAHIESTS